MKKTPNNLATRYYFRLKKTEQELKEEQSKRKKAETENDKLKRENDELKERLKEREQELTKEKDKLKMYAKMIFKEKVKTPGKKKRGAQIGHKGVSRIKPRSEFIQKQVDVTVEICPECGDELGGCKRKYSRVIEDIVVQPEITITKYNIHQYECKECGEKITATPHNAVSQTPFGKRTFAYILFQRYRLKTPLAKIVEALREIHGLNISEGGVQSILKQASIQFREKYDQLVEFIKLGKIIQADETGWRVNGENWWTWLFANDEISLFSIENTRGKGIAEKFLDGFEGILVRDAYGSYNNAGNGEQQVCWVHMLRKAHEYCERKNASREMIGLKKWLKNIYKKMTTFHKEERTQAERILYYRKMETKFRRKRKRKWKYKDTQTFNKVWLVRQQNRILTFLKHEGTPADNNHAERAIRPFAVFRKISGGSKSKTGAKITSINMSIIETWAKQGLSIIDNLPVFGLNPC
jgi:transposase